VTSTARTLIISYPTSAAKDRPFNLVNLRYADYWRDRQNLRSWKVVPSIKPQTGDVTKEVVRLLPTLFSQWLGVSPNEVNYQRTRDRALSQVKTIQIGI